jgi:DNA-binding NarL/FixJ family response regulator
MKINPISILLVDDHKLIRETLAYILSADLRFTVIGNTGSATEAITILKLKKPDIVLLDVNMKPVDGFELARSIMNCSPMSKIIGISMYSITTYVKALFRCGAKGYVTKSSPKAEMFDAILKVFEGEQYVCEEIKNKIATNLLEDNYEDDRKIDKLTSRELEIIKLLRTGSSSKEIANSLHVSYKTIEVHRYNILRKLKLKNRAELVNFVNMNGL